MTLELKYNLFCSSIAVQTSAKAFTKICDDSFMKLKQTFSWNKNSNKIEFLKHNLPNA